MEPNLRLTHLCNRIKSTISQIDNNKIEILQPDLVGEKEEKKEEAKENERTLLLSNSSFKLSPEKQKELVKKQLISIKKIINELNQTPLFSHTTFSLEELSFFSLNFICELIILKVFVETLILGKTNTVFIEHVIFNKTTLDTSQEKFFTSEIYFFKTMTTLLDNKSWISKGNIVNIYKQFSCYLYLSSSPFLTNFIKLLSIVEVLAHQDACLDLPIDNFEVAQVKNADFTSAFRALAQLQTILFQQLTPTLQKLIPFLRETMEVAQSECECILATKRKNLSNKEIAFQELELSVNQHLIERLKTFLLYARWHRLQIGENCQLLIEMATDHPNFLFYLNKLQKDIPRVRNKIEEAENSLKKYLRSIEDFYYRHNLSSKNQRSLSHMKEFYTGYTEVINSFIKQVINILSNIENQYKTRKFDQENNPNFFTFFLEWMRIQDEYFFSNKKRLVSKKVDLLLKKYSSNSSEICKQFFYDFIQAITPVYHSLIQNLNDHIKQWYTQLPFMTSNFLKLIVFKKVANVFSKYFELINKELKETLASTTDYIENIKSSLLIMFTVYTHAGYLGFDFFVGRFDEELAKIASPPLVIAQKLSLEHTQEIKQNLKAFQSCFHFCFNFLWPALFQCSEKINSLNQTSQEGIESAWIWCIDKHLGVKKRKKQKQSQMQIKSRRDLDDEVQEVKNESTNVEILPFPRALYLHNHISPNEKFYPPHSRELTSNGMKIFHLDQSYHLNHLSWTFEMLEITLKRRNWSETALLCANLINHLYLAQEQTITPLYYQQYSEVRHGLVSMSHAMGFECSPDNDYGSIWYRYPHSSIKFNRAIHCDIPLSLNLLALFDETDSFFESQEQISLLFSFLEKEVSFLFQLIQQQKNSKGSEEHLNRLSDKFFNHIKNISSCFLSSEKHLEIESSSFNNLKESQKDLAQLAKSLTSFQDYLINKTPQYDLSPIQDLCTHLRRFQIAIDLFHDFTEQRFLSIHERHLWVIGQYLIELTGIVIAQLEKKNFHTHDLHEYQQLLGLDCVLPKGLRELFEKFNIKKGGDYIYWKFFQNPKIAQKTGLQQLSEAYELSIVASVDGEGFIPTTQKNISLEQKQQCYVKTTQELVSLIKRLIDNKILCSNN